jgi:hypothetical protein
MAISAYKNIEEFLKRKSTRIQNLKHKPIIMKWLESPSMKESLQVIEKKVKYLLEHYQDGGESKLIQWLLSGDINFVALTAERYIIDYLVSQNSNIEDNLGKTGIDAKLKVRDENVGIEVTTLNGFIAEWILIERLSELMSSKDVLDDKTLRITYDHERIMKETEQNRIHQYIKELGAAIEAVDVKSLKNLDVSIQFEHRWTGVISWNHSKADSFPWLKYLTDQLLSKLSESNKKKQLMEHSRNIIFVGVNHIAPSNWAIPSIFEEIGTGGTSYNIQIESIENFWTKIMQDYQRITGICFFYYSLDRVGPFYPLRIIWSNEEENLRINL